MRYIADNDLHIHSFLSSCSRCEEQTPENILKYAENNGLKTVCLTDHMWDSRVEGASKWYSPQTFEHISASLPLPKKDGIRFLFGCETDLSRDLTLGISREVMEKVDFIIIPTTHMHMGGFTVKGDENAEERAKLWSDRFDAVLDMDLPFHKVGVAHLTCPLIYREHYLDVLKCIPENEYHRLFCKAADKGIGIELNFNSLRLSEAEAEIELLPYKIAKEEGCKFYFGSDAHSPAGFDRAKENFENIITLLDLKEEDKFII
ncbi:MAG: PHP domain-containing protein [Ruminococcaceae bacterium]|nr:PHP domain-containing protein [Oscillospiraceae bacterium]